MGRHTLSNMSTALRDLSARSLVAALQSRQVTSVEITQHFLSVIQENNPRVHAVPFVFEAEALAQARDSDARRAAGRALSPLDGLPMTVKDAIRMKDRPSTYGMWMFRNYRPTSDSQLVNLLRKNGVVFLGRSAVPTGSFDWNCRNALYAECVNPFDSSRTPGGSSGGAAAALALGMTPLELGSDLGGSIRYPAHCCGIFGLRTTDGWLPVEDVGPERFPSAFRGLVTFGPMARHLEDLDLLLEIFAQQFHLPRFRGTSNSASLKIAYSKDLLGVVAEPSTQSRLEEFLRRLEGQGHHVFEAKPYPDTEELYRVWGVIAGYEYTDVIPRFIRNPVSKRIYAAWILDYRLGAGPFTDHFKRGMLSSRADYDEALKKRECILREVDRFFSDCDLWILPVAPSAAISLKSCGKTLLTRNGPIEYSRYVGSYTVPTTTLGTPVLTCPIGKNEDGLPVGVQIHGPRFSDRWLVEAAMNMSFKA